MNLYAVAVLVHGTNGQVTLGVGSTAAESKQEAHKIMSQQATAIYPGKRISLEIAPVNPRDIQQIAAQLQRR